jgi:Condensation domain
MESLLTADRAAPLCWGQRYIWLGHYQLPVEARQEFNISFSGPPPENATVGSIRTALGYLVRRHEAFRTTYHPDGGGEGPVQRVHPPGEQLPIIHYEVAGESGHAPEEIAAAAAERGFFLEREQPFRVVIFTRGGIPNSLTIVLQHTTADDWSIVRFLREFEAVHAAAGGRRPAVLPPVRRHPVDLAREQQRTGAPANRRALERWERLLSRVPADAFATRRDTAPRDGEEIAHSAALCSPAMLGAARRLTLRYGSWASLVYTAAFTALLAAYTGSDEVPFKILAGNREPEPNHDLMTCMFQPVPLSVDCSGDATFGEILSRTAERYEDAVANSYFAYDEALEVLARRSADRGLQLRLGTHFNYLSYAPQLKGVRGTTFNWNPTPRTWSMVEDDVYFRVYDWQDCAVVEINTQASVMSRDDVERFLRGFEAILVEQARAAEDLRVSDIARLARFTPVNRAETAVTVDHSLVDLDSVAGCLSHDPAVRYASVSVEATSQGTRRLVAHVATDDPHLTPERLRMSFLDRMYDWDRVICPRRFVIAREHPAAPGRPDAEPADDTERVLAAAVAQVNKLASVDLSRCYVLAGGRVLHLPHLLGVLHEAGWTGPTLNELCSARSLRAIAARLRRDG